MDNINAEDVETVEALGIDSLGVPYVSLTFKEFVSHVVSRYQTLFEVNPKLSVGIDDYTQPGLKAKFSLITFLRIGEVDEFIREVMGSLLSTNLDLTMTDPWDSSSFVSYLTTLLFDFGDVSVAEVFAGEFINLEDIYMYAHEISSTLNFGETLHTYARHDSAEEAFNFCASRGTLLLPLNGDGESSGILKQLSDHVVSFHHNEEAAFWTPYAIWEDDGSWINYLTLKEHCVADIDWRCNNQTVDHDNNGCLTYNPKLSCATHQLCTASKSERRYTTCATTQDTSTLVSGSDVAICRNNYSVDFVEVLRIFKNEFGVDPGQEVIDHVFGYHLYTRDLINDDVTDDGNYDRSVYDFMRNAVGTYVDGKDRSDYAAKDVGKWIFESPNFILFSAAAVTLSHLKENGGDQDDKIQLINTIVNTPDTSVMTEHFGEYGQYVQFLSSRWNFNRQRFLLNGICLIS